MLRLIDIVTFEKVNEKSSIIPYKITIIRYEKATLLYTTYIKEKLHIYFL